MSATNKEDHSTGKTIDGWLGDFATTGTFGVSYIKEKRLLKNTFITDVNFLSNPH